MERELLKLWPNACRAALLLSLVVAVPASCDTSRDFGAPAHAARLLLVGDSITFGVVGGLQGPSFATLLAQEHDVVNTGCPGATADNWNPFAFPMPACGQQPGADPNLFVARALPAMPVDFATVLLGTNDAVAGVSAANYRINLSALTDALLAKGAGHVILLTPPPQPNKTGGTLGVQLLLAAYREQVLDLCADTAGTTCIDLWRMLVDAPDLYFEPGDLHPNAKAHASIAEQVEMLVVPKPSTASLLALALAWITAARRRCGIAARPGRPS